MVEKENPVQDSSWVRHCKGAVRFCDEPVGAPRFNASVALGDYLRIVVLTITLIGTLVSASSRNHRDTLSKIRRLEFVGTWRWLIIEWYRSQSKK